MINLAIPILSLGTSPLRPSCPSFLPSTDAPACATAWLFAVALFRDFKWESVRPQAKPRYGKTLPALNEVFEIITPFDVVVGLVFQHWYWLSDDICE